MKKKVVFILSSLSDNHFSHRVNDFIHNGYEVEVYGFKREGEPLPQDVPYTPTVLAEIKSSNYYARIWTFFVCLWKLSKIIKRSDICFYSSLDIALFANRFIKNAYIFELCDLTHLNLKGAMRAILHSECIKAINNSLLTLFTSEGFYDCFDNIKREKIILVPNKLNPSIPPFSIINRKLFHEGKIRIGYVGAVRYETIYNFVKVCAEKFTDSVEFHIFGVFAAHDKYAILTKELCGKYDNIIYHGRFQNPNDLPLIYSKIDLSIATYTPTLVNVKYAEPNKLYEAIYFRCPIVVSDKVFLGKKVSQLNVGYAINAMDLDTIKSFIDNLNEEEYQEKIINVSQIEQSECILNMSKVFDYIEEVINNKIIA